MSTTNLVSADLDADWPIFDNIRPVAIYERAIDDIDSLTGVILDALDTAIEVTEQYHMQEVGEDGGETFEVQTTIAVRTRDLLFKVIPACRVMDWDGRIWRVKRAQLKSMDTRVMIVMSRPKV